MLKPRPNRQAKIRETKQSTNRRSPTRRFVYFTLILLSMFTDALSKRIAEWDPLNPVHGDVSLGIFDSSYKYKRHIDSDDLDVELSPLLDVQVAKRHHHQAYFRHHDAEAIVDGGHSHVHASRDHDHDHHHHHDDHDHDVHEKIIVEGKDAHVHVHRRSSSLAIPNNHGGSYVVSQLHSRRSPHHRHHAHHDHDEYEKVIIKGKDDHVHIHRDAHASIQKRDQSGFPGTVDIMVRLILCSL